jgi:hypothetical protein
MCFIFFISKPIPRCEETPNFLLVTGECTSLFGVKLDILDRKEELDDVTETDLSR